MKIGLPKEVMTGEERVALTPLACESLVRSGHTVYLQRGAGDGSGYSDHEYERCGVLPVDSAQALYDAALLIIKVKQPLQQDILHLRSDHVLFCYLHLAADLQLIKTLCDIGLTAIPFESVRDENDHLPLLAPMSQVAGRIAVIRGASLLFRNRGGRGVLLGGVDGTDPGRVTVIGAGVAGRNAVADACALGARVDVLDLDEAKLAELKARFPMINTHISTDELVESLCVDADLVVGAVLRAGRRAPVVLKQSVIKKMNPGSVIIDIAIDQGGCVEDIRSTSSEELCYTFNGVIHSAVPNMPAAVARTSSQSLSSAILPYVEALAVKTLAVKSPVAKIGSHSLQSVLVEATAIYQGDIVDQVLKQECSAADADSTG